MGLFVGAASIPWLQQQPDRYGVCAGAADALGGAAGAGVAGGPGPTLYQPPAGHGPDGTSAAVRRGAVVLRREHGGDGGPVCAGGHLSDGHGPLPQCHGHGAAAAWRGPELRPEPGSRLRLLRRIGTGAGRGGGAVRPHGGAAGICRGNAAAPAADMALPGLPHDGGHRRKRPGAVRGDSCCGVTPPTHGCWWAVRC